MTPARGNDEKQAAGGESDAGEQNEQEADFGQASAVGCLSATMKSIHDRLVRVGARHRSPDTVSASFKVQATSKPAFPTARETACTRPRATSPSSRGASRASRSER